MKNPNKQGNPTEETNLLFSLKTTMKVGRSRKNRRSKYESDRRYGAYDRKCGRTDGGDVDESSSDGSRRASEPLKLLGDLDLLILVQQGCVCSSDRCRHRL